MIRPTVFTITEAAGVEHVGPVMGAGGTLGGRDGLTRLLYAQRRAAAGRPLTIYEPKQGHACVLVGYSAASDGERRAVALVGATIEVRP